MGVKIIKINIDTFNRLKEHKLENQTFSQLIDNGLLSLTSGSTKDKDNEKITINRNTYINELYLVKEWAENLNTKKAQ